MTEKEKILDRLLTLMAVWDVQIYRMDRWIDTKLVYNSPTVFIVWERELDNSLQTKLYEGSDLLTALDVLIEGE